MPLGKLSKKQIESAYSVLNELQKVLGVLPVKLILDINVIENKCNGM